MTRRHHILQAAFLIWFVLLLARLGFWQIIAASSLQKQAAQQYQSASLLPASRGLIRSSDGQPLAANQENYVLYVNPKTTPSSLTNLLPDPQNLHRITPELKKKIETLSLSGVSFQYLPVRSYPEGTVSAYITGFVGQSDSGLSKGYFGLEGYYDRLLSGRPGKSEGERDVLGRPITFGLQNVISPRDGSDLYTSIDRTIQYLVLVKLSEGLQKYQASSGTVSIMESQTGMILAMVSLPGYDPAGYAKTDPQMFKNPIISDAYEPGSTFKPLIMAQALDAKVVTSDTVCTICSGPATVADRVIKSYNDKYYPDSSMTDVIMHSDNVGMVFVSRKLGKAGMLKAFEKYNFHRLTGIDLQEEGSPPPRPDSSWVELDLATASFGQGIAVTRLQMLSAFNSLANGGLYVYPRVVTKIITGSQVKTISPPPPTRVLSSSAAAQITRMMVNAVTKGEVRYYRLPAYQIAGKTGTAQIPIEGHYDKDRFIASFIGFAPAQNPKFTMLVTLTNTKTSPWGSTTAAPLWFSLAAEILRYYRL